MGNLLDHFQATQAAKKAGVDQSEQNKEKAVEEAASLERDISTLANILGKSCSVNLLGPIVHVNDVADEATAELKVEVIFHAASKFIYVVEEADSQKSSYPADKFYPFMIDWLRQAR